MDFIIFHSLPFFALFVKPYHCQVLGPLYLEKIQLLVASVCQLTWYNLPTAAGGITFDCSGAHFTPSKIPPSVNAGNEPIDDDSNGGLGGPCDRCEDLNNCCLKVC